MKKLTIFLFLLLLPTALAVDCGDTITSPLTLDADLTCPDAALTLEADLDCNQFTISGNNLGSGLTVNKDSLNINNCIIENFENGILIDGFTTTITENTIANNNIGVYAANAEVTITNNNIQDNPFFGIYSLNSEGIFAPNTFNNNGKDLEETTVPTLFDEPPEETEEITETPLTQEQTLKTGLKLEYNLDEVSEELFQTNLERLTDFFTHGTLERKITKSAEGTKITLTIIPNPDIILTNVSIYERIPKCFAQLIDAIVFEKPPIVLEEDPFVKIIIGDVTAPVSIAYATANIITEECELLFSAIGLADQIKEIKEEEALVRKGPAAVIKQYWVQSLLILIGVIILAYIVINLKRKE